MDVQSKNIGFVSTRIAGTDGVSLEIEKWAVVLERMGANCFYLAGELDRPEEVSMLVPEAHFEFPAVRQINDDVWGRQFRKRETSNEIHRLKEILKSAIYQYVEKFNIDLLIPENALTIPMNIPLGMAITEFLAETGLPAIAHHHDFYWERNRFMINACQDLLDMAFPPDLPSLRHVVINSLAARQLSYRVGISNLVIPNVYDFAHEPPPPKSDCKLREEIGLRGDDWFILQPTRVVPRKWIERSIEIVKLLGMKRPCLVISHASGDEGGDYFERIREYADNAGVTLKLIDQLIAPHKNHSGKKYSIEDVYQCADLVTYPSGYEGFGNAFLESLYYKKPIVVNRYAIYISDIEPKGFKVIAFDGFVTREVIEKIKRVMSDLQYREEMVNHNYQLAKKYFSFEVLEKKLKAVLASFE
ncbi:MAG: glycosyltransferase family 4 protein [Calditrichia bacterium]